MCIKLKFINKSTSKTIVVLMIDDKLHNVKYVSDYFLRYKVNISSYS